MGDRVGDGAGEERWGRADGEDGIGIIEVHATPFVPLAQAERLGRCPGDRSFSLPRLQKCGQSCVAVLTLHE